MKFRTIHFLDGALGVGFVLHFHKPESARLVGIEFAFHHLDRNNLSADREGVLQVLVLGFRRQVPYEQTFSHTLFSPLCVRHRYIIKDNRSHRNFKESMVRL